jgi:hypothetical protein
VETTLTLFRALAADPEFVRAEFDVQWLDRRLGAGLLAPDQPSTPEIFLAAAGLASQQAPPPADDGEAASAWRLASRTDAIG